ncbi:MAG: hypothetical protein J0I09_04320 [Sphingobacteriia bacterium]|nr:hypothetical protein [Sphingobacteriia bacterium]
MPKVLIADFSNWDTLMEVPFVFNKGGFEVDIFCSKNSWMRKNSYYSRWFESPDNEADFARQLINKALDADAGYDWVILGDEKLLSIMNNHIDSEVLFYKMMPLTKIENRKVLASKRGLSELCIQYGIDTPQYLICEKHASFNAADLKLRFPVLLKQDLSWGGGGIMLCNNETEFLENMHKRNMDYDTVIQEFIKGDDIGVEALFYRGELLEYNAGLVKTYFDTNFNFTTRRTYFTNAQLQNQLQKIGTTLGIHGFASIQYIYTAENNTYHLLEVDIRPNIWVASGRLTGHDFSKALQLIAEKKVPQQPVIMQTPEKEVAIFYRDIIRCIKQKRIKDLLAWAVNYKGCCWKFIPFYDKKLLRNIFYDLFFKKVLNRLKKATA